MRRNAAILIVLLSCATASAAESAKPRSGNPATTQSVELPAPTRVTLKLDHTPAIGALRSLFQQAGIASDTILNDDFAQQMADVTVTADLADRPFMVALLEICRQSWLEPQFSPMPDRPLVLAIRRPRINFPRPPRPPGLSTRPPTTTRPARPSAVFRTGPRTGPRAVPAGTTQPSWVDGPMTAAGPFVIIARDARRFSRVDLESDAGAAPARELNMTFLVLCDPNVRLFSVGNALDVDEARDENGFTLVMRTAEPPSLRAVGDRGITVPLTVSATLAYPAEASRKIALLRAHLAATVITRTEPVELIKDSKLVQEGAFRHVGEFRFKATDLQESGPGSRLTLTILRDGDTGQPDWDAMRSLLSIRLLRITDAAGGAVTTYRPYINFYSYRGDTHEFGAFVQFHTMPPSPPSRDGANAMKIPTNVVWEVPTEALEGSVPVELRDLPLP